MAGISTVEVKCVKCKNPFEAEVVDHLDLSEDSTIARRLRTGKANRVQCPKCRKVMYLDRSIVINFEPQSIIVLYDPAAKKKEIREGYEKEYNSIISFNEALEEVASETEFKIVSDIKQLKLMVDEYLKEHG
ncbi:MAG: hypothetical protein EAX95_15200 [Candidatus Thorarchaeota archaeon]|nr:hypothetical protein [Candidatus Thorarchaeota archaeon]